ncbi:acetyl-CoA carboxylase biotin carboxyl carrier protein [Acidobacteriota bacterium]
MNYENLSKTIESLGEILVKSDITSIRIVKDSIELTVNREKTRPQAQLSRVASPPPAQKPVTKEAKKGEKTKDFKTVTSPRVGIFHLHVEKTKEPFVAVGDSIKRNQKVGYIVALGKKFTVKSDQSGIVGKILIDDEMAVEYGQHLFELEE